MRGAGTPARCRGQDAASRDPDASDSSHAVGGHSPHSITRPAAWITRQTIPVRGGDGRIDGDGGVFTTRTATKAPLRGRGRAVGGSTPRRRRATTESCNCRALSPCARAYALSPSPAARAPCSASIATRCLSVSVAVITHLHLAWQRACLLNPQSGRTWIVARLRNSGQFGV